MPVPLGNFNLSDPAHIDGKYRVLQRLGQGGYGTVYLCKSNDFEKNVAVKVLRRHDGDDLQTKRFLNEVKALGKCSHPGIIQVHRFSVTTDGASLYYVMDALNGRSLSHELETNGPLTPRRLIKIFSQVFDALEHAHGYGIVHRDVKPSNIMLTLNEQGEEQAVLIDFGIMRASSPDVRLTATGDMLGTPSYMSPEQCQGTVADFRSDLYSTGCTIYEAATGRPPFEGDSYAILLDHMNNLPSNVPEYLNGFLQICMAKDRTARFASAKDAENALVEIGESAILDVRVPDEKNSQSPLKLFSKPRHITIALCIAGLVSIAAFCGFSVLRQQNATEPAPNTTATQMQPLFQAQDRKTKADKDRTLSDVKDLCFLAERQADQGQVGNALRSCRIALDETKKIRNDKMLYTPLATRAKIILRHGTVSQLGQALEDTQTIIDLSGIKDYKRARGHIIKARLLSRLGRDSEVGGEYELAVNLVHGDDPVDEQTDVLIDYSNWLKNRGNEKLRISILKRAIEIYSQEEPLSGDGRSAINQLIGCDLSHESDYVRQLSKRLQLNAGKLGGEEQVQSWRQSAGLFLSAKLLKECRIAAMTAVEISDRVEPDPKLRGLETTHLLLATDLCTIPVQFELAEKAYTKSKPYKDEHPSYFALAANDLARRLLAKGEKMRSLALLREVADAAAARRNFLVNKSPEGSLETERFALMSAQSRVLIVGLGKGGGKRPTDWADAERSIALVSPALQVNLTRALRAEGR